MTIPREVETQGKSIEDTCKCHKVSGQIFYLWHRRFRSLQQMRCRGSGRWRRRTQGSRAFSLSGAFSCLDPLSPYNNLFSFIIKGFGVRAPVFRPATQSVLLFEKRIIFCRVFNALGDHYYREDSVGSLLRPPGKR